MIKSAAIIIKEDKILLVQENALGVNGLWNWPQGKVEEGETVEEAAIREAKEETGFDIQIEGLITVLENTFKDTKELHVYKTSIIGGELSFPKDEIMDAKFFSLEEIGKMKDSFVGEWVYNTIISNSV